METQEQQSFVVFRHLIRYERHLQQQVFTLFNCPDRLRLELLGQKHRIKISLIQIIANYSLQELLK